MSHRALGITLAAGMAFSAACAGESAPTSAPGINTDNLTLSAPRLETERVGTEDLQVVTQRGTVDIAGQHVGVYAGVLNSSESGTSGGHSSARAVIELADSDTSSIVWTGAALDIACNPLDPNTELQHLNVYTKEANTFVGAESPEKVAPGFKGFIDFIINSEGPIYVVTIDGDKISANAGTPVKNPLDGVDPSVVQDAARELGAIAEEAKKYC